jgi:hypothetical protein
MRLQTENITFALFGFFMLSGITLLGKDWTFKVFSDTSRIRIGEQFSVTLQASAPKDKRIIFPNWNDSLMKGLELVSEAKTDTIQGSASILTYRKKWLLTAFDSGYFPVPPLTARLSSNKDDSISSEAFLISVQTVSVDTSAAIKPIKGPREPDFSIAEWWKEISIALLLVLSLVLFIIYIRKRKRATDFIPDDCPKIPPSEWAWNELEMLKTQNLPSKGLVKEYYVRLSEITRTYIEMELGIPALESTTDEILVSLRLKGLPENALLSIHSVMQLCDLAKFAKANPQQAEHDASFKGSLDFVNLVSQMQKTDPEEK